MALLESYRYRLHVRRFIVELFDKSVVEQLVRGGGVSAELAVVDSGGECDEDLGAMVGLAT